MRALVTLFILLLILSFFGISIRSILLSPTGKDNLTFLFELGHTGAHIIATYILVVVHNILSIFKFFTGSSSTS